MAIQDILATIAAEADKKIKQFRETHQSELSSMRQESEQRTAKKKQEIAVSKEQKMGQLKGKAQSHADAHTRNALLSKKKDLLDSIYSDAVVELSKLSDKEIEPLLQACVKLIKTKGEIHPSEKHEKLLKKICSGDKFSMQKPTKAKGGFLFVSEKEERDFTFEHIVSQMLRPKTELEVSHNLFS